MMQRMKPGYEPPFELLNFTILVQSREDRRIFADATVKVRVGDRDFHTAAEGNGPVNALDKALRKALTHNYPQLQDIQLADYKVQILDGNPGTAAGIRVLIDSETGARRWNTVGASTNIIEASWRALADSMEIGEIRPLVEFERQTIAEGKSGPITHILTAAFHETTQGRGRRSAEWLEWIDEAYLGI